MKLYFKLSARFNTQFRVTRKFYFFTFQLYKLRTLGNKSQSSFATKPTFNFGGAYRRVQPPKLTNHSARINYKM